MVTAVTAILLFLAAALEARPCNDGDAIQTGENRRAATPFADAPPPQMEQTSTGGQRFAVVLPNRRIYTRRQRYSIRGSKIATRHNLYIYRDVREEPDENEDKLERMKYRDAQPTPWQASSSAELLRGRKGCDPPTRPSFGKRRSCFTAYDKRRRETYKRRDDQRVSDVRRRRTQPLRRRSASSSFSLSMERKRVGERSDEDSMEMQRRQSTMSISVDHLPNHHRKKKKKRTTKRVIRRKVRRRPVDSGSGYDDSSTFRR